MKMDEILKLKEGAYVEEVDGKKLVIIRLREGFTLTALVPQRQMLIQRYSEHGNLLWEDRVEDVFSPRRRKNGGKAHEDSDC